MSFQGPASWCPVYHQSAIGLTWDTGMWAHPFKMGHLGMGSFQGVPCHSRGWHPCVPCTIGWPPVSDGTLGCGPSHSRWNTLEWDHSKVFCGIPGAHIHVSCVLLVGHWPYMEHWDVGPQPQDGTPWYGIIPGCSMLFLEPILQCPTYDRSAICIPRDTGTWAHSVEMEHPQIIPFQSVPRHSGGPHSSVPCTHSWPLVLVLVLMSAVGVSYQ